VTAATVVDCDAVLFAYAEHHTSEFVRGLFDNSRGYLQADASNVYDILLPSGPNDGHRGGLSGGHQPL
jgi:hypothetical protein